MQLGGQVVSVDLAFRSAHVRRPRVAPDSLLHRRDHRDGVELDDRQPRVRDQYFLVGQPLDLELAEHVADEREAHDVVAGATRERDLVDAAIARSSLSGYPARDRCGGHPDVAEREAIAVRDAAADYVRLGQCRPRVDGECEDHASRDKGQSQKAMTHGNENSPHTDGGGTQEQNREHGGSTREGQVVRRCHSEPSGEESSTSR